MSGCARRSDNRYARTSDRSSSRLSHPSPSRNRSSLLRAEANIGLNNVVAAMRDINYVRVHSASLAPKTITTQAAALTQLLYEKRYSLLWESPSRWVDARLYNRLNTLPLDQPTHKVHRNSRIPTAEVLGRGRGAISRRPR